MLCAALGILRSFAAENPLNSPRGLAGWRIWAGKRGKGE